MNRTDCDRLNEQFTYTRKSVQKMNLFKFHHGWERPHVVAQTAVYELGDIQELYYLQDRSRWTPENIRRYYQLPWYTPERYQRLCDFLDDSLADGERDKVPGAPLLKKALLPSRSVYWATLPLWHLRGGPAEFFKIIRLWSFSERLAQRHLLWPDGLGWMAQGARKWRRRAQLAAAPSLPALPESVRAGAESTGA